MTERDILLPLRITHNDTKLNAGCRIGKNRV